MVYWMYMQRLGFCCCCLCCCCFLCWQLLSLKAKLFRFITCTLPCSKNIIMPRFGKAVNGDGHRNQMYLTVEIEKVEIHRVALDGQGGK